MQKKRRRREKKKMISLITAVGSGFWEIRRNSKQAEDKDGLRGKEGVFWSLVLLGGNMKE